MATTRYAAAEQIDTGSLLCPTCLGRRFIAGKVRSKEWLRLNSRMVDSRLRKWEREVRSALLDLFPEFEGLHLDSIVEIMVGPYCDQCGIKLIGDE